MHAEIKGNDVYETTDAHPQSAGGYRWDGQSVDHAVGFFVGAAIPFSTSNDGTDGVYTDANDGVKWDLDGYV